MAELESEGRPERPMLRRAIRHALRSFDPSMRVFAEDFLAEVAPIDLLAVGGEGELVAIRIGEGGDDASLLTRCLSDIGWLRPRIADFLKLAPTLGLERSAEPRAMLACPEFTRETRSATSTLPAHTVELLTYHDLRERGPLRVLLGKAESPRTERSTDRPAPSRSRPEAQPDAASPPFAEVDGTTRPTRPASASPTAERFRTGLSDADLGIEGLEEKNPE